MRVEARSDRVLVSWSDGALGQFPYVWLRDNCLCPECRHPDAWERTVDTVALDADIRPTAVDADERLDLTWPDGHRTAFSSGWLQANPPGAPASDTAGADPVLWTGAMLRQVRPEIDLAAIEAGGDGLLRWLR
ncbi:MAG: DUF971 domain-containing protein, partial [Euzebyales bacterium]|nr:DUF971 domain-containing protein [Euzebyales bacterium]